jgi:N-acetylmuramic acid 6-phosphate etherase
MLIETGPEAIAGSTRLKAGTAQKVALNLFSTAVMAQLGRVYQGMMVDMRPTNAKLRHRSEHMVAKIAGCSVGTATDALGKAGGDIKAASLMAMGVSAEVAVSLLAKHNGNLRAALAEANLR